MGGFNVTEQAYKDYHEKVLHEQGLAFVQKIDDPVNIAQDLGKGKILGFRARRRWTDWGGFMLANAPTPGRAIYHETKHCPSSHASLRESVFKRHQLSFLTLAGQNSVLAFASVYSERTKLHYAVPWEALAYLPLKWRDLEDFALDGVDWWSAVGRTI